MKRRIEIYIDVFNIDFTLAIFFSSFHILPNINKLMILADGERILKVLFVGKSEKI